MGRHATSGPEETPRARATARGRVVRWSERLGFGVAAAAGTLGVLRWAGTSWTAALWIVGAVVVVVPTAAWLASTVPGHDSLHHRP